MASCTQIDGKLQAYIDGELSQSEQVIVAQHVSECPVCAVLLKKHQRISAMLFESLGEKRLTRDLTGVVMEHLPEMEHTACDVEGVNWRVKHPLYRRRQLARMIPFAAATVLVVAAVFLLVKWPSPMPDSAAVGVVAHAQGATTRIPESDAQRLPVTVNELIARGERYETGSEAAMMLVLTGPTRLYLNRNTRVRVQDERRLSVEKGEVWLDVSRDSRLFRVLTPAGDVTVFGTAFDVRVDADTKMTTVSLARGELQVENDHSFLPLTPGEQVDLVIGREPSRPRQVDVQDLAGWTDGMQPDRVALRRVEQLARNRGQRQAVRELAGESVWVFDIAGEVGTALSVSALRFSWETVPLPGSPCAYDIYISDEFNRPLFKTRIERAVFAAGDSNSVELEVPRRRLQGVRVLHVKTVPDFGMGSVAPRITEVSAVGS